MKGNDIAELRLVNQHIAGSKFTTVKDVVACMGAMQAQDYAMSKWAIGIRLKNPTEEMIEDAIDKGEIIRTHLLRPTWHFVSADDIYWILQLTAPRIYRWLRSRDKFHELSEKIYLKTYKVLESVLRDGNSLTREEIRAELKRAKINTDENRASLLFMGAELEGIICSGNLKGKKLSYALLEERVPKAKHINREEALAKLARRYFNTHSPATLQDFSWWSGLAARDAKLAIDLVKEELTSKIINEQTFWFNKSLHGPLEYNNSVHLLPAFDEFIISYTDRSAAILPEHSKIAISNYGMFKPLVLIKGKTSGLWKRSIKKDTVIIETELFSKYPKSTMNMLKEAAEEFGSFLGKEAEIKTIFINK